MLTPMAVDSSRPFPLIHNKSLNIAALVRKKKTARTSELEFAMVQVPCGAAAHGGAAGGRRASAESSCLEEVIERNIDRICS